MHDATLHHSLTAVRQDGGMRVIIRRLGHGGAIKADRDDGEQARHEIEAILRDVAEPGEPMLLDFEGVDAVMAPWIDGCLVDLLSGRLRQFGDDHLLTTIHGDEPLLQTVAVVLKSERLVIRTGPLDEHPVLLGAVTDTLSRVLEWAHQRDTFSAGDLAHAEAVKTDAAYSHIKRLLPVGALARRRGREVGGGADYVYTARIDLAASRGHWLDDHEKRLVAAER